MSPRYTLLRSPRPANRRAFPTSVLSACLLSLALAACGGGDSDETAPTAEAPPVAVAPGPDTEAPVVPSPGGDSAAAASAWSGDCNVANFVSDAIARVNAFRAQPRSCGGTTYPAAPALVWNEKLAQAAHGHSLDMAVNNYFSHTSRDGRTFAQRISATGYTWRAAAENIAAGQSTMASVMASWQGSAGHCKNLMSASYTQVGLSCAKGRSGASYGTYWTMNLARPQ